MLAWVEYIFEESGNRGGGNQTMPGKEFTFYLNCKWASPKGFNQQAV